MSEAGYLRVCDGLSRAFQEKKHMYYGIEPSRWGPVFGK